MTHPVVAPLHCNNTEGLRMTSSGKDGLRLVVVLTFPSVFVFLRGDPGVAGYC